MPQPSAILDTAAAIAKTWWGLAIVWHAFFGALVLASWTRKISQRTLGWLLVPPLACVSALAWAAGNPVNGAFFATLSLALTVLARRLPRERTWLAAPPALITGVGLFAFGWLYPHFLDPTYSAAYAVAAPLGLLPCPTLSAVIGVVLMFGVYRARWWAATIAGASAVYGMLGVFWLGVTIDLLLIAGAVALWVFSSRLESSGSVRATDDECTRALPGDDLTQNATRLIARARGGAAYRFHGLPRWATKPVVTVIHFVMQRKQLLGIAKRAEAAPVADGVRGMQRAGEAA